MATYASMKVTDDLHNKEFEVKDIKSEKALAQCFAFIIEKRGAGFIKTFFKYLKEEIDTFELEGASIEAELLKILKREKEKMTSRARFKQMYDSLPEDAKTALVLHFTTHPMTLVVAALEIEARTKLGNTILRDLGYL